MSNIFIQKKAKARERRRCTRFGASERDPGVELNLLSKLVTSSFAVCQHYNPFPPRNAQHGKNNSWRLFFLLLA
jgi:hypothetical protein